MFIRILLAATVAAAVASPSGAAEWLHRKPGLWTTKMAIDALPMTLPDTKMCLDANTDAKLMEHGMQYQKGACAPLSVGGMGAVRTVDSVCHAGGGMQKTHMVLTYKGDSAYHIDVNADVDMGQGKPRHVHSTQDARWLGPCPADMKPGDMMVGGMKMNVLNGSMTLPHGKITKEQIEQMMKAQHHQ
jgi:hypothetical protein